MLTNAVFHGNTLANIHTKPGTPGADEAGVVIQVSGSGGNNVQNNLWFNCTDGVIRNDPGTGTTLVTHDFNRWLNTGISITLLSGHDFRTASGAVDPFVTSSCTATGGGCDFHLSSETVDTHLNDGNPLATPFNVDYAGNLRGADATWERGAFEFSSGSAPPAPPTNLTVVVH